VHAGRFVRLQRIFLWAGLNDTAATMVTETWPLEGGLRRIGRA
jgi:hypothetical protein